MTPTLKAERSGDCTQDLRILGQAITTTPVPGLILLVCLLLATDCSWLQGTGPVPFTKKAYTATYRWQDDTGRDETWVISADGKGLVRTEIVKGTGTGMRLSIADYLKGKVYHLDPETKKGFWVGLKSTNTFLHDEEWLQVAVPVTSNGEKEIDGHRCRGWTWTISTGATELWFGMDTGCLVFGANRDNPSNPRHAWWTENLVQYSPDPMPAPAFDMSDYHVVALP